MSGDQPRWTVISFGPFEADLQTQELRKLGVRLRLPAQSFQILKMLLERSGKLVTREELQRSLWPSDTFVDAERGVNAAVNRLRDALGDSADTPHFIETLPRRGYRFIGPMPTKTPEAIAISSSAGVVVGFDQGLPGPARARWKGFVILAIVIATLGSLSYLYFNRMPKLTDKDTIVVADFLNTTGDSVFDGTLRQGLSVQLEQSPFLSLVSESRIQQTLPLMGLSADANLSPKVAQEVCQRLGCAAVIQGSIAQFGTKYSLILRAVNCSSGELLASTEARSDDKTHVLDALGRAASQIRNRLDGSLHSPGEFDKPLGEATTPSLEAFQDYSLALRILYSKGDSAALPLFQRSVDRDPNFASAYAMLGIAYGNLGENALAYQNLRKAFELRERVSEREKLFITAEYYFTGVYDNQKAQEYFELWAQEYPRDWAPRNELGNIYRLAGQYESSLTEFREALRLFPENGRIWTSVVGCYRELNRFEEARVTAKEMEEKGLDSPGLRLELYSLAFLQNDSDGMNKQVEWSRDKPGVEDIFLGQEADTAAYSGRLEKARKLTRQAVASAERTGEKEAAASYVAAAALREALFGNAVQARQEASSVQARAAGADALYNAALVLAMTGKTVPAQELALELTKRYPESTDFRFNSMPTLWAQIAISRSDASKAIEMLQVTTPYELGDFYSVYVRGEAYLSARQGSQAQAEFKKILEHRGALCNSPFIAMALMGLARAYVLQGDTVKARKAFQDFLELWKDADSGVPLLIAAKAEFAQLH